MKVASVVLAIVMGLGATLCCAQTTQPSVFGAGYYAPAPTTVAPGQVLTLFVWGPRMPTIVAESLPLPTSLGGYAVSAKSNIPGFPTALPIFRVDSYDGGCALTVAKCDSIAITVQIPMEGKCIPSVSDPFCYGETVVLTVQANGISGQAFPVFVDYRHAIVHVLTSGDTIVGGSGCLENGCSQSPYITHADGSLVTAAAPAHAGETIVIYAVGLGITTPAVKSGEAAPSPQPTANAEPISISYFTGQETLFLTYIPPLFTGLVTGYVGLYQVNIKLPGKLPDQIVSCSQNGWNTLLYSTSFCWVP